VPERGSALALAEELEMSSTGMPLVSGRNQYTNPIAAAASAAKQTRTPLRLMAFCGRGPLVESREDLVRHGLRNFIVLSVSY
jgi:hypothetical protein